MPLIFFSRTLLPLEAAYPAGRTVFGTLHFQISTAELIKYFWKLSPDTKIILRTYRASYAFVIRTLPPLETTYPAGHAILRCRHPYSLIVKEAYKIYLDNNTRYNDRIKAINLTFKFDPQGLLSSFGDLYQLAL